jgi:hypothetical protein
MDKAITGRLRVTVAEPLLFLIKSGVLLIGCAVVLYGLLAATYPPLHDTLHNFRHALAVVPCH